MCQIIFILFFIICIICYLNNKTIKKSIGSIKCKKKVKFCDPIIKSIHFY